MSVSSLLAVLLVASSVYANAIPEPQITPAAVLPRQATDQRFIGYYSTIGESTWDTSRCPIFSSWSTSGSYGRCCSTGLSCEPATRCSGDYALVGTTSVSCTTTCNTDYIYASSADSFPIEWIGCAYGYSYTSFYRDLPATARLNTYIATTQTGLARPTVTGSSIVPTTTPIVWGRKKKSMIWIVGVVIGIVAIFAIAGIIACILVSKKKKTRAAALASQQQQNPQNFYGPPPVGFQPQMQQQQQYMQPPPPGSMGMAPMQGQYGGPSPEGGYYQDPKTAQTYTQPVPPSSPPPPVWTPSQQHQSISQPPVSPQTRHASLAASDVLAVEQQRNSQNRSPGGTVSEIGSSTQNMGSPNSLGSNPNLTAQNAGGLSSVDEVGSPTYPQPVVQKVLMQGNNPHGPVSELH